MTDVCDIEFLTIDEAAELLRITPGTLNNLRSKEDGPPYRRHGGRIVYERTVLVIKPIAAGAGDVVCRHGAIVTINGRNAALAKAADAAGRPLPHWQGCRRLDALQIFVLSPAADSFDSRYFGPLDSRHVLGSAVPVWTFQRSSPV